MARGKEFGAKRTYQKIMDKKANESPLIFARVGNGGGVAATGRANFYWIRLINDDNRLTQCYSMVPLANNDWIYVREAKDRKLRYYEFAVFIQDAAGGTDPPVSDHDHSGAGEGGQLDWDDIWTDAVHTHANAAEGGQLDWDNIWTDAVHDHSAAGEGGQDLRQIQEFEVDDAALLTINAGTVTRTQVYHIIAAEAGVADNLDQIDGGTEGDVLVIQPDAGDTITVRHNAGGAGDNIWLAAGADIALDNDDHLALIFNGTWWCDLSGGAGGACVTLDAAYDCGGAGVGRTITADAGAVQIDGVGGLGSQGNIVLDDGAGDSPQLQFVGGSNNDTAIIFLDDSPIAANSDLIIRLVGNTLLTDLQVEDSGGNDLFRVLGDGTVYVEDGITYLMRTAARAVSVNVTSAATNSVLEIARLLHQTSGVAAAGFGARLLYTLEEGGGNLDEAGAIDVVWANAGSGTEDSYMIFLLRDAGAALAEICRIDPDGLLTIAGTDVYPDADTAGLAERCINLGRDPIEDFRGAFGWLTTGWAGAPFDGVPDTEDFTTYPDFAVIGDGTTNDRFFRYRTIIYSLDDGFIIVARLASFANAYVGIRLDTGDDTDFTELYVSTAMNGLCDIVSRYQENGAGINTNTELSQIPIQYFKLRLAAAANNSINCYYAIDTQLEPRIATARGDIDNWSTTPTRVGIIYQRTAGSNTADQRGYYDWFYTDLSTP